MDLFSGLKGRFAGGEQVGAQGAGGGRWEAMMGSGLVMMAVTDRAGLVTEANEALCAARGGTAKDVLGTALTYLLNVEEREGFKAGMREVLETGRTASVGGQILTVSGAGEDVQWLLLPEVGEGRVMGVTCLGLAVSAKPVADGAEFEAMRETVEALQARLSEEEGALEGLRVERDEMASAYRLLEMELEKASLERVVAPVVAAPPERFIPGMGDEEGDLSLREVERRYIARVLEKCGGRVSGAKGAAKILGLHANTLRSRMEKLGISAATRPLPGLDA